jgi:hypothetical protein
MLRGHHKRLPAGTLLSVRIIRDEGTFVTKGKIICVNGWIAMGVAFLDPPTDPLMILESSLTELPPGEPSPLLKLASLGIRGKK